MALYPHWMICLAHAGSFEVRQLPPWEMMTVGAGVLILGSETETETEKGSFSPVKFVI
jgi:hypothetical protein